MLLTFATFWGLVGWTWATRPDAYREKSVRDWILDGSNLLVQGLVVPLAQVGVVGAGLRALWPDLAGAVALPFAAALALNLIGVDLLYYANHRLLHTRWLWPLHRAHHTVTRMDVLATSRNTLWTTFAIVYVWANGALTFLLADPRPVLLGAAITASLDLWRHSELHPPAPLARLLGAVLILPADHARHHSADGGAGDYGANLKLWDQLFGTARAGQDLPTRLGVPATLSLPRTLLWPFP